MEFDGEPVEFEWNTFAGHTTLDLLHEIHRKMTENRIKLEEFEDRIIFMSMSSIGRQKETSKSEFRKPEGLWNYSAEMMMLNLGESGHPVLRATSALDRGTVESYRFTTMVTRRMQSCFFAQLLPSTSSVPAERSRIGAKNWLRRSQIIFVFQHRQTRSEDE